MTVAYKPDPVLVDQYVQRDAWMDVLYSVAEAVHGLEFKEDETDQQGNMTAEVTAPLLNALWPEDPDDDADERVGDPSYEAASTRAIVLQAAILMQLTTADAQEFIRAEAARLAKLAADRLAVNVDA